MTRRDDLEFTDQYREFDRATQMEDAGYETMPFGEDSIPPLYGSRGNREIYQEDGEVWETDSYRFDEYASDRYEEYGQDRYDEYTNDRFWENSYETPGFETQGYETAWGETDRERDEFFNFRKALKFLKPLVKIAAPMIGTALGGPVGGLVGTAASALLREGQGEGGWDREQGLQLEAAYSPSLEWNLETPLSHNQQMAESLAAAAAQAQSDREADVMTGAAVTLSLTPAQRAELRHLLRHLLRATVTLTRLLRRRRDTRVLMRVVPTLVSQTASTLARAQAAGRPISPATVGTVMAAQTRRILQPAAATQVVTRSIRTSNRLNSQPRDAYGRFSSVRG